MRLFGLGRTKPHVVSSMPQTVPCKHPVSHQVPLREDPSDYKKVTAFKCSQCGERLPVPERAAK